MKIGTAFVLIALLHMADEAPEKAIQAERMQLQGTWTVVSAEENGKKLDLKRFESARIHFDGNKITREGFGAKQVVTYTVDVTKKPKVMDGTDERGRASRGIYELDGDMLKICWTVDRERPSEFATKPNTGQCFLVFKHMKP